MALGRVGKENQGRGHGKLAAALPQKFLQRLPLEATPWNEVLTASTSKMACTGEFSRLAGLVARAKGENRLRLFVVENGKVLLLQAGHRVPGLIGYDYVERNAAHDGAAERRRVISRRRD